MSREYLTLIFRQPISDEVRAVLKRAEWIAATHSNPLQERDECNRRRLEAADHFAAQTALMKEKFEALRAKIEAMERQEPVARVWRCDNGHIHGSCEQALPMGAKLYLAPGAAPEAKP